MGTNFYFKIKYELNLNFPEGSMFKEELMEKLKWTLEEASAIHIGKRSGGWYPLFQKTKYYSSVKDIKDFYIKNEKYLSIIDEYDREYTLNELEEELFTWNADNNAARSHMDYGTMYYLDSEGYEFTKREFS